MEFEDELTEYLLSLSLSLSLSLFKMFIGV